MKKFVLLITILGVSLHSKAQQAEPDKRILGHTVGVQFNELVKQVFNFNNSTTAINNPFLLTYNITLKKSGIGLRTGIGYNHRSFAENDGITKRSTDNNDLNFRLGIEKAFELTYRWSAGVGIDAVLRNYTSNTDATVKSYDTTNTVTKSKLTNFGGGAMAWLRYAVSNKVLIGTEASFYYVSGKQTDDVTITRTGQTVPGITAISTYTASSQDYSDGTIRVPVAIYLLVRF